MSAKLEEVKAKKTLTSTVKENPLASVAIAAISSALVTFLSQTYATTAYVQVQRKEMIQYFDEKVQIQEEKTEANKSNIVRLESKLDKMDLKLDDIKENIYALKARR
jgi:uncharacterized membrane protein